MKLFFDTETTGVPKNYKAPVSDVENWSRLVQLGYILVDNGKILHEHEAIIKPVGFEIPVEVSNVHGITTEMAMREGKDIRLELSDFLWWANYCDTIIGHNISFDMNIVGAEFWRLHGKNPLEGRKTICTMMSGIDFCGLPGKFPGKLKYPKLEELYMALFLKPLEQKHTALDDIQHTVECYHAMIERGIIKE